MKKILNNGMLKPFNPRTNDSKDTPATDLIENSRIIPASSIAQVDSHTIPRGVEIKETFEKGNFRIIESETLNWIRFKPGGGIIEAEGYGGNPQEKPCKF